MKIDTYNYERIIVQDLIKICSNVPKITYYSFGENFKERLLEGEAYSFKIIFDIRPNAYFRAIKKGNFVKYSDCVFLKSNKEMEILYSKKLYPIGELFAHIFFYKEKIVLYVNKFYNSLFKFRVENVLPPGSHLTYLTYLKLLLNGFISLHGACFALDKKESFLVMSPPNTGKSFTVMKAIANGFYYLAEDICVVNVNNLDVKAVPHTSTFFHETSSKKYLGPLGYFVPITDEEKASMPFIQRGISASKLKKIFILEPSDTPKIIKNEFGLSKIFNLNKLEFDYRSDIIVNALLYSLNINLELIEYNSLSNLAKKVDVITVKGRSPIAFFDLIREEINL
jgi:hypothetical protein